MKKLFIGLDLHKWQFTCCFMNEDGTGMIPEAILCSDESEMLRRIIRTRKVMVDTRVKLKNQIHGILLGIGIGSRRCQLNSKKGRANYPGLVPWVNISDKKEYYGHITKYGPEELRTALAQMVLGMIRSKEEKNNTFMLQYIHIKKNTGSGKALIAIARKFIKLINSMQKKQNKKNAA